MSDLDKLKSAPKAKRRLKGLSFQFSGAEVSYTSSSQGGAASGENEAFLFKSKEAITALSDEQQEILELIGEEATPLKKEAAEQHPPSSDGGGNVTKSEDEESDMDELKKANELIEQLTKKLAVQEKTEVVKSLSIESEMAKEVVEALASVDVEVATVFEKAFQALEAEIEKAKGEAGKVNKEANPLAKALSEEEGHEEKPEVTKSFKDKIKEELSKGAK